MDCRFSLDDPETARREYDKAHIPGAVYAHLEEDLSDMDQLQQGLGRHPLPDESALAQRLGRWGWTPGQPVVAYDAAGGALAAARLWWLLRTADITAAVLDGGLEQWIRVGLPLAAQHEPPLPTQVQIEFDANQSVASDAVEVLRDDARRLLLDARAAPRFRGDHEPIDRIGGHVPGARNRPFSENLDDDGRFKSVQQLRAEFDAVRGDVAAQDVVHMCGSGVTACHNLLAMEHAGLHGSRLYAPSWSGWVSDPSRDVATGEA